MLGGISIASVPVGHRERAASAEISSDRAPNPAQIGAIAHRNQGNDVPACSRGWGGDASPHRWMLEMSTHDP